MPAFSVVNSFNGGELSPKLLSRPDIDAYSRGCQTLKNFIPTACGAAERRPGMEYISGESGDRLLPFVFSSDTTYLLSFGADGSVRASRFDGQTRQDASVSGFFLHNALAHIDVFQGDDEFPDVMADAFSETRRFRPDGKITIDSEQFLCYSTDTSDGLPVLHLFGGKDSTGMYVAYLTSYDPSGLSSWASSPSNGYLTDPSRYYQESSSPGIRLMWRGDFSYADVRCLPSAASTEYAEWTYTTGTPPEGYEQSYEVGYVLSPDLEIGSLDTRKFQCAQSADVVFIAHPDIPPHVLKRISDDEFTLDEMKFKFPPSMDGESSVSLSCNVSQKGASGTLSAASDFFTEEDVGRRFVLTHSGSHSGSINARRQDNVSHLEEITWMRVYGDWSFSTHGTWRGTVEIRRGYGETAAEAAQSGEVLHSYSSENDFNVSLSGSETERNAWYYVAWYFSDMDTACTASFVNPGFQHSGSVLCTGYVGRRQMKVLVESSLFSTGYATSWRDGAFSSGNGYPECVAFFQQRLFFAGTTRCGGRIWGSATDSFDDFEVIGNEDASGLDFTIYSQTVSRICWMQATDVLVIGTTDDEWTVAPGSQHAALTASSLKIERNSSYGSAYPCPCLLVQDRMMFAQRDRRRLRSIFYSFESDSYRSEDLSVMADHILEAGIKEVHIQRFPETVVWCVLNDGSIAGCTFDSGQNVAGWFRCETDGKALSMCVLPQKDGDDMVFLIVSRSVFSASSPYREVKQRSLERLLPGKWTGIARQAYLDRAIWISTYDERQSGDTRGGSPDVAPHAWMDGSDPRIIHMSVNVPASFCVVSERGDVFNGIDLDVNKRDRTISLPRQISGGWIGVPFESVLSPMPAEQAMQDGISMLRRKTVHRILVDFYGTIGGETRVNSGPWTAIDPHLGDDDTAGEEGDSVIPARSSVEVAAPFPGHMRRVKVEIRQSSPFPMCVASIAQHVEVGQ